MKRRGLVSAIAAVVFARSVVRADAVAPPAGERVQIVSIDTAASVIVVRTGGARGRERPARYSGLTRIRVGGMLAAITDLRPGMQVTVRFAATESGREGTMLVSIDAASSR